jgi:hypothetical protein
MDPYEKIIHNNLARLYRHLPENLDRHLPAERHNNHFNFEAFGEIVQIGPEGIRVGRRTEIGVRAILISLYALHAKADPCIATPFKAFRELPNSMPYHSAFTTHTERLLVPHIDTIEKNLQRIIDTWKGNAEPGHANGDFSFRLRPFPKIVLNYIFYRADEEFPASATCLCSCNALSFLPIDALADTAEYTSRKILDLVV